jgi:hypothetical protein
MIKMGYKFGGGLGKELEAVVEYIKPKFSPGYSGVGLGKIFGWNEDTKDFVVIHD